jgi:outer membrane protein assembly factor BamE (lipoprotein component of BamABCDE complex)
MTPTDHGSRKGVRSYRTRAVAALVAAAIGLSLTACGEFSQVYRRGYIVPEGALEQLPLGASQEQVLIVLGTPSTVATVSGEAFYYISQRAEQPLAFMTPAVTNQRVIAVYFDKTRRVERIADFGMKDGKVFDFIGRTTPTTGQEMSYLNLIFAIAKPW